MKRGLAKMLWQKSSLNMSKFGQSNHLAPSAFASQWENCHHLPTHMSLQMRVIIFFGAVEHKSSYQNVTFLYKKHACWSVAVTSRCNFATDLLKTNYILGLYLHPSLQAIVLGYRCPLKPQVYETPVVFHKM